MARDGRFGTRQSHRTYDDQLIDALGLAFREKTASEWEATLRPEGVRCVRVDKQSFADFFLADANVKRNGFIPEVGRKEAGVKMIRRGSPVHFFVTPGKTELAHLFAEEPPNILAELDSTQERIESMKAHGIANWTAPANA